MERERHRDDRLFKFGEGLYRQRIGMAVAEIRKSTKIKTVLVGGLEVLGFLPQGPG